MSGTLPSNPPECVLAESPSVELLIDARPRDLGGFTVRRVLPSAMRRLVGPFIFFDHMGPVDLAPGAGFDVRPHPHIGLATVTYLFEGEIMHRDSVGSVQAIRPGDINWMVAGRGIAHSERSPDEVRKTGARMQGIQTWVALPIEHEETAPSFEHHPASSLPRIQRDGVVLDILAGTAFGETSPVKVLSPTLKVHALLEKGAELTIDTEHEERAFYVVNGTIGGIDDRTFVEGTMVVLRPGVPVTVRADEPTRLMIIGGAHLPGERSIYWNFVSSNKERLDKAKDDWKNGRFDKVAGDETDFIPLPTI